MKKKRKKIRDKTNNVKTLNKESVYLKTDIRRETGTFVFPCGEMALS